MFLLEQSYCPFIFVLYLGGMDLLSNTSCWFDFSWVLEPVLKTSDWSGDIFNLFLNAYFKLSLWNSFAADTFWSNLANKNTAFFKFHKPRFPRKLQVSMVENMLEEPKVFKNLKDSPTRFLTPHFLSFGPAWATDQWVKIVLFLVSFSLSYSNLFKSPCSMILRWVMWLFRILFKGTVKRDFLPVFHN